MFVGSDPDVLDRIASTFLAQADKLLFATGDVDYAVRNTAWVGDDAWALRNRWTQGQKQKLESCQQLLLGLAAELQSQAAQQRDTSRAIPKAATNFIGSVPTVTPTDPDGSDEEKDQDPDLKLLEGILLGLGLSVGATAKALEIAKDLVEGGKFTELLEFMSKPGVADFVGKLDKVLKVSDVVFNLIKDFAGHESLPVDERIVHAVTDAAIRFGISEGAEAAGTLLGGAIGSIVPVGGTLAGAAIGKAAGFVIGEVIEWGVGKIDEKTDFVDDASDLMVDSYRYVKDHADDAARLVDGAVDVISDSANALGNAAKDAVGDVVDGAGRVVDGAGNAISGAADDAGDAISGAAGAAKDKLTGWM